MLFALYCNGLIGKVDKIPQDNGIVNSVSDFKFMRHQVITQTLESRVQETCREVAGSHQHFDCSWRIRECTDPFHFLLCNRQRAIRVVREDLWRQPSAIFDHATSDPINIQRLTGNHRFHVKYWRSLCGLFRTLSVVDRTVLVLLNFDTFLCLCALS